MTNEHLLFILDENYLDEDEDEDLFVVPMQRHPGVLVLMMCL